MGRARGTEHRRIATHRPAPPAPAPALAREILLRVSPERTTYTQRSGSPAGGCKGGAEDTARQRWPWLLSCMGRPADPACCAVPRALLTVKHTLAGEAPGEEGLGERRRGRGARVGCSSPLRAGKAGEDHRRSRHRPLSPRRRCILSETARLVDRAGRAWGRPAPPASVQRMVRRRSANGGHSAGGRCTSDLCGVLCRSAAPVWRLVPAGSPVWRLSRCRRCKRVPPPGPASGQLVGVQGVPWRSQGGWTSGERHSLYIPSAGAGTRRASHHPSAVACALGSAAQLSRPDPLQLLPPPCGPVRALKL